ncbi:MAG: hypothetical protein FWC87_03070 [Acidimicrobiaceae bacterium]|nr:hypothetical protein [Acidimicrobiaceae bacterium]
MEDVAGLPGELIGRLIDTLDAPAPQLRAFATTLLIRALELPLGQGSLVDELIGSDRAAALIDREEAAQARARLREGLAIALDDLAAKHGEMNVVRVMRDHLVTQVQAWASRAVDDVDNRRRAERFLAWAERPDQLRAAQRRGLFAGMDAGDLRRLAENQVRGPVTPETAVGLWSEVERWLGQVDASLGDPVLDAWQRHGGTRT